MKTIDRLQHINLSVTNLGLIIIIFNIKSVVNRTWNIKKYSGILIYKMQIYSEI